VIISKKDIDKIYDILFEELTSNGMTREINSDRNIETYINDYGMRIDNFCGIFGIIKGEKDELEKTSNKLYRSSKKLKYNVYNKA
jgi:hypothetical protein